MGSGHHQTGGLLSKQSGHRAPSLARPVPQRKPAEWYQSQLECAEPGAPGSLGDGHHHPSLVVIQLTSHPSGQRRIRGESRASVENNHLQWGSMRAARGDC
jgi:hypothetical protein